MLHALDTLARRMHGSPVRGTAAVLGLAFLAAVATPVLPCVCDDHPEEAASHDEGHACCAAREQALSEAEGPALEDCTHDCCHARAEIAEAMTVERASWQSPAPPVLALLPAVPDRSWRRAPAVLGVASDRAPPAPLAERLARTGVYRC
ncbi:MAG: hypothetical protein ACQEXJ_05455 [Myxococcota bacterium]